MVNTALDGRQNAAKAVVLALSLSVSLGISAAKIEHNPSWTPTAANTLETMYDYHASGNWSGSVAPSGNTVAGFLGLATTRQYITFSQDICHAALINENGTRVLVSDNQVRTDSTGPSDNRYCADSYGNNGGGGYSGDRNLNANLYVFAPFHPVKDVSGIFNICGDWVMAAGSAATLSVGLQSWRGDYYANSADEMRTNEYEIVKFNLGSASPQAIAPLGNPAMNGVFAATTGSPYIYYRSGASSAQSYSAGARIVDTPGVADGTFVKRVFYNDIGNALELSAPYTGESGDVAFSFAAYNPKFVGHIDFFSKNGGTTTLQFDAHKRNAYGTARIEIDKFEVPANIVHTSGYYFSLTGGTYPITLVMRNGKPVTGTVNYNNTEVEFDFSGVNGVAPGFPHAHSHKILSDRKVSFVATNGVEAVLGGPFIEMLGTLEKKGVGSLSMVAGPTNGVANAIVVNEGTLVVTNSLASLLTVKSITVAAGATLKFAGEYPISLEGCDLAAGSTVLVDEGAELRFSKAGTVAAGAVLDGAGTVKFGYKFDSSNFTIRPNVKLTPYANVGAGVKNPVAAVPGTPAFWVDCSRSGDFVLGDGGNTEGAYITRWNDCRGSEYGYCEAPTNGRYPNLYTNSVGEIKMVRIPQNSTASSWANTYALRFGAPIAGIRHVFKLVYTKVGVGAMLGSTEALPASDFAHWSTFSTGNQKTEYFDSRYAAQIVLNGAFSVDGALADSANGVAEQVANEIFLQSPHLVDVAVFAPGARADNFGMSRAAAGHNGYDNFAECIIYTNELTYAERQQVTEYLMTKWCNRHAPDTSFLAPETSLGTVASDRKVSLDAGASMKVDSLSGAATLTQEGAGTLLVADAAGGTASLKVAGGAMTIRSYVPSAADIPSEGRIVDFDASALATITTNASGVSKWTDAAGGTVKAAASDDTGYRRPFVVEGSAPLKSGMPVVDFGEYDFQNPVADKAKQVRFFVNPAQRGNIHTALMVFGSERGGGPGLFGCGGNGYNDLYGIIRGQDLSDYTVPIPRSTPIFGAPHFGECSVYTSDFRRNGEKINPRTTGHTGSWDVMSFRTYTAFGSSYNGVATTGGFGMAAFALDHYSRWSGAQLWGELILYSTVLKDSEIEAAEAYLNRKWFDRETVGYRAASLDTLEVAAGASVTVDGNAPVTVKALKGAGTVTGSLVLAANAELTAYVDNDGTITPAVVSGDVDLSAGGTVHLVGDLSKLEAGTYTLVQAGSAISAGTWTCDAVYKRSRFTVKGGGSTLTLTVSAPGVTIIFR